MGDVVDNLSNGAVVVVARDEDVRDTPAGGYEPGDTVQRSFADAGTVDLEMKVGEGGFDVLRELSRRV